MDSSLQTQWPKVFSLLLGLSFFTFSGVIFSTIGPFFTLEARQNKHLSATVASIAACALNVSAIITSLVGASLIKQHKLTKTFILAVFVKAAASVMFGAMAFVQTPLLFFAGTFLLRFLLGVAVSVAQFTFVPLAVSWYPNYVARVVGFTETATFAGFVVGPACGSLYFEIGLGFPAVFSIPGAVETILASIYLFTTVSLSCSTGMKPHSRLTLLAKT